MLQAFVSARLVPNMQQIMCKFATARPGAMSESYTPLVQAIARVNELEASVEVLRREQGELARMRQQTAAAIKRCNTTELELAVRHESYTLLHPSYMAVQHCCLRSDSADSTFFRQAWKSPAQS